MSLHRGGSWPSFWANSQAMQRLHFFQREYGNLACGEGAPSRLPTPPPLPPMTCQIILARCSCPPYPINLLCVNSDPAKREGPFGPSLTLILTLTQGTKRSLPSRQKKSHTKKRDHLVLGPKNRTPLMISLLPRTARGSHKQTKNRARI